MDSPISYEALDPSKPTDKPIRLCKGNVLFFTGKDVPVRRYASFIHLLEHRFDKQTERSYAAVYVCHSIGIMRGILYAFDISLDRRPHLILSMDGSNLSEDTLNDCRNDTEPKGPLARRLVGVLYGQGDRVCTELVLYRNDKSDTYDTGPYSDVVHYDSNTGHHPYNDKEIAKHMLARVAKAFKHINNL